MTTDMEIACRSLVDHEAGTAELSGSGFADCFLRHRFRGEPLDLGAVWLDIESSLEAFATAGWEWRESGVPSDLVHAVSGMMEMCMTAIFWTPDTEVAKQLQLFGWRLSSAWNMVQTPDGVSIRLQLAHTASALGIDH